MPLELGDPLAHRALQALLRAEAAVRRRVAAELSREGVSAAGFSVLVVLTTAGGSLELRTLRRRLGWSKANATEVTATLEARQLRAPPARPRRPAHRRRRPDRPGRDLVERLFPEHSDRVTRAFGALDEGEKRSLPSSAGSWRPSARAPDVGDPDGDQPRADLPAGDAHPHPAEARSTAAPQRWPGEFIHADDRLCRVGLPAGSAAPASRRHASNALLARDPRGVAEVVGRNHAPRVAGRRAVQRLRRRAAAASPLA